MMWTTTPSSGYNGFGGTTSGSNQLASWNDGYLTISADDGPGMNRSSCTIQQRTTLQWLV